MSDDTTTTGDDGITLKDVIFHIQGVQQSLEQKMDKKFEHVDKRFERVEYRLENLEFQFGELRKDIEAAFGDIIAIKQHVGMPVALE